MENKEKKKVMSLSKTLLGLCLLCLSFAIHAAAVNINTADAAALAAAIDGVGMKRAEAIVAYRNEYGPFKSVDDLVKVKGLGEKTLDNNRDKLTVSDPAK
jgi:competence protein ComEA